MNLIKYALTSTLAISSIAQACNPVLHIDKGTPAPCEGFIFSLDKEQEIRKQLEEYKTLKFINANLELIIKLKDSQIDILGQQVTLWQDQSTRLSKQVIESQDKSFWRSALYFGLGALVTTGLAFAVNKATK